MSVRRPTAQSTFIAQATVRFQAGPPRRQIAHTPPTSGFARAGCLRTWPRAHIPVIAMGALAMHHDTERGLKAGFFRYLAKLFRIDTFRKSMDGALTLAQAGPPLTNSSQRAHMP